MLGTHTLLVVALVPLAACASQVDSEHQGDALAEIAGEVRNTRVNPIPNGSAEVVLLWVNSSASPDITATDAVEVTGTFPAQFSLAVYEPPVDATLNNWNGVQVGVALIIAGVAGTDWSSDQSAEAGLLGMDENHLLVYVPEDVPAGSDASVLLRGTPAQGFHLYGVYKLTEAEKDARTACIAALGPSPSLGQIYAQCGGSDLFDDFVPLATDLDTPLEIYLVDDPNQIDPPNWT